MREGRTPKQCAQTAQEPHDPNTQDAQNPPKKEHISCKLGKAKEAP